MSPDEFHRGSLLQTKEPPHGGSFLVSIILHALVVVELVALDVVDGVRRCHVVVRVVRLAVVLGDLLVDLHLHLAFVP